MMTTASSVTHTICSHCGEFFHPKYPASKLCYPCWQARERAFEENWELRGELEATRRELFDVRARLNGVRASPPAVAVPPEMLRKLILLCHPDKHANSEVANDVTSWLLQQRRPGG